MDYSTTKALILGNGFIFGSFLGYCQIVEVCQELSVNNNSLSIKWNAVLTFLLPYSWRYQASISNSFCITHPSQMQESRLQHKSNLDSGRWVLTDLLSRAPHQQCRCSGCWLDSQPYKKYAADYLIFVAMEIKEDGGQRQSRETAPGSSVNAEWLHYFINVETWHFQLWHPSQRSTTVALPLFTAILFGMHVGCFQKQAWHKITERCTNRHALPYLYMPV